MKVYHSEGMERVPFLQEQEEQCKLLMKTKRDQNEGLLETAGDVAAVMKTLDRCRTCEMRDLIMQHLVYAGLNGIR